MFVDALNQDTLSQESRRPGDDSKTRPEEIHTYELGKKESPLTTEIWVVNNFPEEEGSGRRH